MKRAKSEIRNLIREKGFILSTTELQPILDTLLSDFPKTQRADILGSLALDRDKIHRERYDMDLHKYVEVSERKKRAKKEEGSDYPGRVVGGYNQEPFNDRDFYQ